MIRLDRCLANLGYGSRTEAKIAISRGRVRVGGEVCKDPAKNVNPTDVLFDHEPLDHPFGLLIALNKPTDYVCTHDVKEGDLVYDLLPEQWSFRNPQLVSIGRLDKDSTGLLMLTDNHALVHQLTSPKRHVQKRYRVVLNEPADQSIVDRFAEGTVVLDGDDKPCKPAELSLLEGSSAEVVMTEGRFRQVRRMFQACGRTVLELNRTHFGEYELGDLPIGEWRDLSPDGPPLTER